MAKFLKSIFTPEKKNRRLEDCEDDKNDFTPPLDGRRKLSISRSGRMKQAQKKRHSLTMDLYGENYQPVEKPKSVEYHVNNSTTSSEKRRHSLENQEHKSNSSKEQKIERTKGAEVKTPEEEIESAFEIIDKVS